MKLEPEMAKNYLYFGNILQDALNLFSDCFC